MTIDDISIELAVAESTLAEDRARLRSRETEINITNTNSAIAAQSQAQSQAQQQFQLLAQLTANVHNLANDIQSVKQSSVVFNSGRMNDSGNQGAANTRVA